MKLVAVLTGFFWRCLSDGCGLPCLQESVLGRDENGRGAGSSEGAELREDENG